ncbi:MAG: FHA domain-containing protein [Lachnospiraceae bacterium]|nr:FHA domain-containing protein [Lachnospiraceae bacterium]
MQAEYKKEWTETYLWVPCTYLIGNIYKEKMLLNNPDTCLLEFSKSFQDGQEYYKYRISGKKSLFNIYAVLPMRLNNIKIIVKQLLAILEHGQELLLSPDDFVVDANYIFTDMSGGKMSFCYVPGYGKKIEKQLESFFEYLLNRVDYDDKKAVELLYDCYVGIMKGCGRQELAKILADAGDVSSSMEDEALNEAEETEIEPLFYSKEFEKHEKAVALVKEEKRKTGCFGWLFRKRTNKKNTTYIKAKEKNKDVLDDEEDEGNEDEFFDNDGATSGEKGESEKTVLLYEREAEERVSLTWQRTGKIEDVDKFPYIIGSVDKYSDLCIRKDGISRMHCSLTKKGEHYYINDLNSTNGTFLNGKEVKPAGEYKLVDGDIIKIGREEMVFLVSRPKEMYT